MTGTGKLPAVLSIALGLIVFAPSVVQAQGPAQGPGQGQGQGQPQQDPLSMYKAIGADEGQLGQIRSAVKQFEDESRTRAQQIFSLMKEMRGLSSQPDPDEPTVLAKQTDINKVSADQAIARTKLMLAVRKILRPDQKQKLVQMAQQAHGGGAASGGAASGTGN